MSSPEKAHLLFKLTCILFFVLPTAGLIGIIKQRWWQSPKVVGIGLGSLVAVGLLSAKFCPYFTLWVFDVPATEQRLRVYGGMYYMVFLVSFLFNLFYARLYFLQVFAPKLFQSILSGK